MRITLFALVLTLAAAGIRPPAARANPMAGMSADMLMAVFLKLNITDPNNSPQVHESLRLISKTLRRTVVAQTNEIERLDAKIRNIQAKIASLDRPVWRIVFRGKLKKLRKKLGRLRFERSRLAARVRSLVRA